jgi:formylglycine-generating enzyme required for sulfatase activity
MVNASDFQIDATEVRVKDYLAFLDAAVPLATQPDVCTWNVSFHPHDSSSPFGCTDFDLTQPNRPIGCVDWCDAAAFCAWRGKRLCGKRGGG